jgi:uncharacterized membrane protein
MPGIFTSSKIILFLLILFWCIGFTYPLSRLIGLSNPIIEFFLKNCYGNVCHQQHDKLLEISGIKLFVCWRCAGIYLGAFTAGFFNLFISKKILITNFLFAASSIPIIVDVTLYSSGVYSYNNWTALLTGMAFAMTAFNYAAATIENQIIIIRGSIH